MLMRRRNAILHGYKCILELVQIDSVTSLLLALGLLIPVAVVVLFHLVVTLLVDKVESTKMTK